MRKKVSYTVEETVINDFNILCEDKAINKSALIEKLMLQWIDENKKESDK